MRWDVGEFFEFPQPRVVHLHSSGKETANGIRPARRVVASVVEVRVNREPNSKSETHPYDFSCGSYSVEALCNVRSTRARAIALEPRGLGVPVPTARNAATPGLLYFHAQCSPICDECI